MALDPIARVQEFQRLGSAEAVEASDEAKRAQASSNIASLVKEESDVARLGKVGQLQSAPLPEAALTGAMESYEPEQRQTIQSLLNTPYDQMTPEQVQMTRDFVERVKFQHTAQKRLRANVQAQREASIIPMEEAVANQGGGMSTAMGYLREGSAGILDLMPFGGILFPEKSVTRELLTGLPEMWAGKLDFAKYVDPSTMSRGDEVPLSGFERLAFLEGQHKALGTLPEGVPLLGGAGAPEMLRFLAPFSPGLAKAALRATAVGAMKLGIAKSIVGALPLSAATAEHMAASRLALSFGKKSTLASMKGTTPGALAATARDKFLFGGWAADASSEVTRKLLTRAGMTNKQLIELGAGAVGGVGRSAQFTLSPAGAMGSEFVNTMFDGVELPNTFMGNLAADLMLGLPFHAMSELSSYRRAVRASERSGRSLMTAEENMSTLRSTLEHMEVSEEQLDDLVRARNQAEAALNPKEPTVEELLRLEEQGQLLDAPPSVLGKALGEKEPNVAPLSRTASGDAIDAETRALETQEAAEAAERARAYAEGHLEGPEPPAPAAPTGPREAEPIANVEVTRPGLFEETERYRELQKRKRAEDDRTVRLPRALLTEGAGAPPVLMQPGMLLRREVTRPAYAADAARYRELQRQRAGETDVTVRRPQAALPAHVAAPLTETAHGTFTGVDKSGNARVRVGAKDTVTIPLTSLPANVKKGTQVEVQVPAKPKPQPKGRGRLRGEPIGDKEQTRRDIVRGEPGVRFRNGEDVYAEPGTPEYAAMERRMRLSDADQFVRDKDAQTLADMRARIAKGDLPQRRSAPNRRAEGTEGYLGQERRTRSRRQELEDMLAAEGIEPMSPLDIVRDDAAARPEELSALRVAMRESDGAPISRTDNAMRDAIARAETDLATARTNPSKALDEAVTVQRARVLALAAQPDNLRLYLASVHEALTPEIATRWARSHSPVDLATFARNAQRDTGFPAFMPIGAAAGASDDDDTKTERLMKTLAFSGLTFLGMKAMSPRARAGLEASAKAQLKAAERGYESVLARIKAGVGGDKIARQLDLASKRLAAAKANMGERLIGGAELASMVGKASLPTSVIDRMSPDALRDHIRLRANDINSKGNALNFIKKYQPYLRQQGAQFFNETLDRMAERFARMDIKPEEVNRLAGSLMENRRMEIRQSAADFARLLRTEMRGESGVLQVLSDLDRNEIVEFLKNDENVQQLMEGVDRAGLLRDDAPGGISTMRFFENSRHVMSFDNDLHLLNATLRMRDLVREKLSVKMVDINDRIIATLGTEGERAGMFLHMRGKQAGGEIPFGPLPPITRLLKDGEVAKAGERVEVAAAMGGSPGGRVAIFDPNPTVQPIITQAVKDAALEWRNKVLDPLAKLAGLPTDQFLEYYFPRVYHRETLESLAKSGMLSAEASDRVLAAGDVFYNGPMHGNDVLLNALMARKLPDWELYMKDPRQVAAAYINGAVRKIAFDPVLTMWERIQEHKPEYQKGPVNSYVNGLIDDALGTRIHKADRVLVELLEKMQSPVAGQRMIDAADRWTPARLMGLKAFGQYLREPGARPATRLAHTLKGISFARMMGFSVSSPIINIFQPALTSVAQASPVDFFKTLKHAPFGGDALFLQYMGTGMPYDQAKFFGSKGMWDTYLDSVLNPSASPIVKKIFDGAGYMFQRSERLNTFRAYALARLEAESKGRVYRTGKGYERGALVTDKSIANLIGILESDRTQFGGRTNQASVFRDPVTSVAQQFMLFNYRMLGLVGAQYKQLPSALKRVGKLYGEGKTKEAAYQFTDNVLAPVKTMLALYAVKNLMSAYAGVDDNRAFSAVYGFIPFLDRRELAQGKFRATSDISLGPFAGDVLNFFNLAEDVRRSWAGSKDDLAYRISQLALHGLPIGTTQAKRLARAYLEPGLSDKERMYIVAGFRRSADESLATAKEMAKHRARRRRIIFED